MVFFSNPLDFCAFLSCSPFFALTHAATSHLVASQFFQQKKWLDKANYKDNMVCPVLAYREIYFVLTVIPKVRLKEKDELLTLIRDLVVSHDFDMPMTLADSLAIVQKYIAEHIENPEGSRLRSLCPQIGEQRGPSFDVCCIKLLPRSLFLGAQTA